MSVEKITSRAQYLTFGLDDELYALDIIQVQSVLDFDKVTKVPRTPPYMRGVINLRGSVLPIVDLKLKFGMEETKKTIDSCIIIVEVDIEGATIILGCLADSVKEVIEMNPEDIEPAPKIGNSLDTDFIKGMGKNDDNFIIILDLNKVFSLSELSQFKQSSHTDFLPREDEDCLEKETGEKMPAMA